MEGSVGTDAAINDSDGLKELQEWLFNEVADDNDIVVDEMEKDFAAFYEDLEDDLNECQGSDLYKENIQHLTVCS